MPEFNPSRIGIVGYGEVGRIFGAGLRDQSLPASKPPCDSTPMPAAWRCRAPWPPCARRPRAA